MDYKSSVFNLFVSYDDNHTIIHNTNNSFTGLLENDFVNRMINGDLNEEEIDALVRRGFLVDKYIDEFVELNKIRLNCIRTKKEKHFRIWTTTACNATCFYCFEKGIEVKKMDIETMEDTYRFIANILEKNDILSVEWFGGEPLLNIDVIDKLTKMLKEVCSEKDCIFTASIITNGSLINSEIIWKMKNEWSIHSIQVTLDGFRPEYNIIKGYINPHIYNFDVVIRNIKDMYNAGLLVGIRVNYTTDNFASILELLDFLHEEFREYKKFNMYIHPIWGCLNEKDENAFKSSTFADINLLKIFDKMVEYKFVTPKLCLGKGNKDYACASCLQHTYTIYPDGKIGKCCESFEYPIGDVINGVTDPELKRIWDGEELDDICTKCVYLPKCQGGCNTSRKTVMPKCFPLKQIFPDVLRWYVNKKEQHL